MGAPVVIHVQPNSGKTESFLALHFANQLDLVALEDGSIISREELWEHLKQSLLERLAKRMFKPRKGRRADGPGASLSVDPTERTRIIRTAYDKLWLELRREPRFTEVAHEIALHPSNLWRWRRDNGWPPPPNGGTL